MRIGIVGLGRMGGNIAVRLTRHGHEVVVHDHDPAVAAKTVARAEARPAGAATHVGVSMHWEVKGSMSQLTSGSPSWSRAARR